MLLAALAAGACLRFFFVLKYPAGSGDSILYEQIATNWLKYHVYAMNVGGAITPVDIRVPGYPAFLAADLLVERQDRAGCALLGDDRAGGGGFADVCGRGLLGGDVVGFGNREGAPVASFFGDVVADGTVPLHGQLCGGSAY